MITIIVSVIIILATVSILIYYYSNTSATAEDLPSNTNIPRRCSSIVGWRSNVQEDNNISENSPVAVSSANGQFVISKDNGVLNILNRFGKSIQNLNDITTMQLSDIFACTNNYIVCLASDLTTLVMFELQDDPVKYSDTPLFQLLPTIKTSIQNIICVTCYGSNINIAVVAGTRAYILLNNAQVPTELFISGIDSDYIVFKYVKFFSISRVYTCFTDISDPVNHKYFIGIFVLINNVYTLYSADCIVLERSVGDIGENFGIIYGHNFESEIIAIGNPKSEPNMGGSVVIYSLVGSVLNLFSPISTVVGIESSFGCAIDISSGGNVTILSLNYSYIYSTLDLYSTITQTVQVTPVIIDLKAGQYAMSFGETACSWSVDTVFLFPRLVIFDNNDDVVSFIGTYLIGVCQGKYD